MTKEPIEWKVTTVRISKKLIEQIERHRAKRVGLGRNAWILEAIQEKLLQEGADL